MAGEGINLAGAIGMTGKRESVISDLPAYIKDTGDYLAARNEQRRKEEAAKKAQEQEWENNQQENFSKNVSAYLGSGVKGFNEKYEKYAQNEMAKAYTAHVNPKLTLAQKQKAREEAHLNIANARNIYLNAEEDVDKRINPVANDDKYASQEAVDYLQGKRPTVSSEITENVKPTQGNPLAQIPQSDISTDQSKAPLSSSNPLAPIENKNNIEKEVKVTTTHNKPLYEMNHEEIAKDYENGVAAKVLPMVKLHETSLDKIASEAIPSNKKTDFIKITKENINGVDKVTKTINHEGMVNAVESIYTNIITQSGKEATRMYNKLHQDAYIASKGNKNITNEQDREVFMDDYIKEHALGAAKTWVDTEFKNQSMANENIDRTANHTTNNYYGNPNIPEKANSESGQVKFLLPSAVEKQDTLATELDDLKTAKNKLVADRDVVMKDKTSFGDLVTNVTGLGTTEAEELAKIDAQIKAKDAEIAKKQAEVDSHTNQNTAVVKESIPLNTVKDSFITLYTNDKDQNGVLVRPETIQRTDKGDFIIGWSKKDGTDVAKKIPLNNFRNKSAILGAANKKEITLTDNLIKELNKSSKTATPTKKEAPKSDEYDTWKKSLPQNLQNESDYDLEGFYNKNKGTDKLEPSANFHLNDEFKKPNHITFSKESKYSKRGQEGGTWVGSDKNGWTFKASPYNLQYHSVAEMKDYFAKNEKNSKLVLPEKVSFEIDGKVGEIPIDNVDAFKAKYPNAKVK